jgi:hypothetical protein
MSAILMVIVLRRPVLRVWKKWSGSGDCEDSGGRRRDDAIIAQFLSAYKESVQIGTQVAQEINNLAGAIREQATATNQGFRDTHRKLDTVLTKHGH